MRLEVAEDLDRGLALPGRHGAGQEALLRGADHGDPHRLLQLEDQAGADGLDDRRSAALLALFHVQRGSGARRG